MAEKGKPCPFCGGIPMIKYNSSYIWVECTTCRARTRAGYFLQCETQDEFNRTVDTQILLWNQRTEA